MDEAVPRMIATSDTRFFGNDHAPAKYCERTAI